MSVGRRVVGAAYRSTPAPRRSALKTPDISVIDFAELLRTMTPTIAVHPQKESQIRSRTLRADFKHAQALMTEGNLEGCHQACIDLINTPNLPIDLKIETIHIMSTLVPLDQALTFLEDALRLAANKTREQPNEVIWSGLFITTTDQMWKIQKLQGAIKFHRQITFGDPIAAARDRDMKKGNYLVKKQVQFDENAKLDRVGDPVKRGVRPQEVAMQTQSRRLDRPLRTSSCPKTLYRKLELNKDTKPLLFRANLAPKFACFPSA